MHNPKFDALLQKMKETHDRKNADYAAGNNPYSNFELTAEITGNDVDDVFITLMGVKLARLRELRRGGKTPQNESVQDTRLDLAVYAALYASYYGEDSLTSGGTPVLSEQVKYTNAPKYLIPPQYPDETDEEYVKRCNDAETMVWGRVARRIAP